MPGGILVVVQIAFRAFALGSRIQRIYEHRSDRRRARYFDPGLAKFIGNGRDAPRGFGRRTRIGVARHAAVSQRVVYRFKPGDPGVADAFCESAVQVRNEREQTLGKGLHSAVDLSVFDVVGTGLSEFAICHTSIPGGYNGGGAIVFRPQAGCASVYAPDGPGVTLAIRGARPHKSRLAACQEPYARSDEFAPV